jgi:hypothetical protein
VTFDDTKAGAQLNQGAIIDTAAVGNVDGPPDSPPEIVIGTNEEYKENSGNEGPANYEPSSFTALGPLLEPANSRLYAVKQQGDPDGDLLSGDSPFVAGWPAKVAILDAEVLPIVGEGITGSPVISEFSCPSGGAGPKIGSISAVGPGYVFNANGTSCYGGKPASPVDVTLKSDAPASSTTTDRPAIPAFGQPVFGNFGGSGTTIAAPAAGLVRALDVVAPEYQIGGQDMVAAWAAESPGGPMRPNFPARVNDLQFLSGPAIADIDGASGGQEEIVEGSAHNDLAAYTGTGAPVSSRWPKLTSDWMVTTPLVGSFGTLDVEDSATKTIVAITRSGSLFAYATPAGACSPGSWPKFHHDNANSGDTRRDATSPGVPFDASFSDGTLAFRAPGDDLLCGKADRYELVHSDDQITGANFDSQEPLAGALAPAEPGERQSFAPPGGRRYVGIRAVDEQGNVGRPLVVDRQAPGGGLTDGGGPGGTVPQADGENQPGGSPRCLPRSWRLHRRGFGRIRVGMLRTAVVAAAGLPQATTARSMRYCVEGGGTANATLSGGRVGLVGTTARGRGARRVGRGSSLRRARRTYGPLRRRGRGVYVASRRGPIVVGARRGRVRYLAVTGRTLTRFSRRGQLIGYLRFAGLR